MLFCGKICVINMFFEYDHRHHNVLREIVQFTPILFDTGNLTCLILAVAITMGTRWYCIETPQNSGNTSCLFCLSHKRLTIRTDTTWSNSYVTWDATHETAQLPQATICCTPPWCMCQQGIRYLEWHCAPTQMLKVTKSSKQCRWGAQWRATTCKTSLKSVWSSFRQESKLPNFWIIGWTPLHG